MKRDITYFYRAQHYEHSIEQVFGTVASMLHITDCKYLPYHRLSLMKMAKNILYIVRQVNHHGVNHVTGDINFSVVFMFRAKTVLTIHDLGLVEHYHGFRRFIFRLFWFYLPVKRADIVTCISQKTKEGLVKLLRVHPDKIRVIHNPVGIHYKYTEHRFNSQCPVILHVGTNSKKNLARVIMALQGIPCELRIIGKLGPRLIELLKKHGIRYSNVYNLTEEEVVHEYNQCDVVSFPSLYEGFGMPIIEGQTTGRVVLTSLREPMTEVAGQGALFVDPTDVASIREGFKRLIAEPELRDRLIWEGRRNAEQYQPRVIADAYQRIYDELSRS